MAIQKAQSEDCSVASLFQSFCAVPDYQRDCVRDTDRVEQLLKAVGEEMGDGPAQDATEYFSGSIVVCPARKGVLDLIDGQQRMTTLYITHCAIRDRFAELGAQPSSVLNSQIADAVVDVSGAARRRYRPDLQYEYSDHALTHLADGKRSQNARYVVTRFLEPEFGQDAAAVRKLYEFGYDRFSWRQ